MDETPLESLKGRTYAFVDVETTGVSARYGQIIEIAIIRVEDGVIVEKFETLLQPDGKIPALITDITGIRDSDVEGKPRFEDVSREIHDLLEGAVFVAHNARFDYGFVKNEFKRLGTNWNAKTLCTVKISRDLYTQKSHSLEAIIQKHKIQVTDRHRAFADTYAMVEFLRASERKLGAERVLHAIEKCLATHTLPSNIDPKLIKDLPHSPGVYFFYDKDDTLLYIGKSVDIKNRVRSHFSQDHVSAKERVITKEVAHIDYEVTSGELSALLRESALIKDLKPIYNRRLRRTSKLALMKCAENEKGYMTSSLSYDEDVDIGEASNVAAIFRTLRSGKAVINDAILEHKLCPKLLGLEAGKGACFQFQLGRCNGGCVGKESPALYNARFDIAFAKMRIRAWPYPGPIVLPEDEHAEEGAAYLVNKWKILKKYTYTAEGQQTEEDIDQPFDFDTYRILSKHLLNLKHVQRPAFANLEAA